MDRNEKISRLKSMLAQVTEGADVNEALRPVRSGSRLESFTEGVGDTHTVGSGLEKLADGRLEDVSTNESYTLEAIVMPQYRPVVFVRDAVYDNIEDPWTHLNAEAIKNTFKPLIRSIGRVEVPAAPWLPFGGTGFVVGPNLLMTNRHVAALFTQGLGFRLQYQSGDAAVNFKRERDSPSGDRAAYFDVQEVLMIHPYWDMALLRVTGLEAYQPLTLSVRKPDDLEGNEVLAVGYPARDDRNDLALQDKIFAGKYEVKRVQPGKLRARSNVTSFKHLVNAITHDSSTLGGNSGSAILDVQTGEVVGLHFGGEYLKANYAVPAYELARDKHVAAEKVKLHFAGALPAANDWEPYWDRAAGTETSAPPAAPKPPDSSAAGASAGGTPPQSASSTAAYSLSPGASSTWVIPVRITVSVGETGVVRAQAGNAMAAAAAAPTLEFPTAIPKIYGGLQNRKGYVPGFLEFEDGDEVPLPTLTQLGTKSAAKLEDGSTELKYHKFSVVMHKERRLAIFTASNVDWRPDTRLINGRKPTRKELTELEDGVIEQWVTDSRIADDEQLPDIFFTKDKGAFDKGHLVRRDDVAWGKPFKDMQKANGDTYHTTNCSPQVAAFNRPKPSDEIDNWGDLESLVQSQTKAERAILFSGPVLDEDDPLFEGRDDQGKILVRIPRRFWKIIVVKGDGGPEAYGFVLEQDLSAVPLVEFAVSKRWRRHMKPVSEIEDLLQGLVKLPWIKKFDQFGMNESVRTAAEIPWS